MNGPIRKCRGCGEEAHSLQALDVFVNNSNCKYGKDNWCKKCNTSYAHSWNKENKGSRNNRERGRTRNTKALAVDYLGGECLDCGTEATETNICIFDFHHLDPSSKEDNPSFLLKTLKFTEKVIEELDKCVLLCANCHRLRHYNKGRP